MYERATASLKSRYFISSDAHTISQQLNCTTALAYILSTRVPLAYTDFNKGHVTIKVFLEEAVRVRERKVRYKAPKIGRKN